jgi:hypothetical protein
MRYVWRGVVVVVSTAILTVTVTAAFGAIDWRQLMRRISLPRRDDGAIEGRVTIQRSIDDVFKFYRVSGMYLASWGTSRLLSRWVVQLTDGRYKARWAFE